MKRLILILFISSFLPSFSQTKNFIDQPYVETSAKIDTLVTPDKIFLDILITEKDSKGKISVEELEKTMYTKLSSLGINIEKQLTLNDLASNYKKYFLKSQDINKSKNYSLLIYDAKTAGKVLFGLEDIGISNVSLEKTEYSKVEELKLALKAKAVLKARNQALNMAKPLNQKIGTAIYISDGNSNNFINALSGRASGIMVSARKSIGYAVDKGEDINIEFQKINVVVEVNVFFKLE